MDEEEVIEPAPEVDRTLIREWILDRIKTDPELLNEYHNNAEFHARVFRLAQTDDNREATEFIVTLMVGREL